jgi:hypothetical protein
VRQRHLSPSKKISPQRGGGLESSPCGDCPELGEYISLNITVGMIKKDFCETDTLNFHKRIWHGLSDDDLKNSNQKCVKRIKVYT